MELFGYSILQIGGELPTLAVLVTGLVLAVARRGRLPHRARALMMSGIAVLLVVGLVGLAWTIAWPHLLDFRSIEGGGEFRRFRLLSIAVGVLAWIGYPVGTGLLVAAVLAGRPVAAPAVDWAGWTPPAGDDAGHADPGPPPPAPAATQWGGTDLPAPPPAPDRT
ncbi:hypothetical protein [Micromonospora purpureochromogenes]|uniref:Uncharacterized protein n=1 Tax=Micromonospora purpureochromogenes TaxID=47872 RepID=A0ABX2RHP1_9ACTN|nr:hypothetical protein [Micromonospora purpureochromogenes]NYF54942.1 hypothetical protein [Micromonospora purpureochromogenes]